MSSSDSPERPSNAVTLRARWVFPVAQPPIDGGTVTIAEGRVAGVGKYRPGERAIDLGNVAILPGLINAHTHLEFSDLPAPLGRAGAPLPEWIREVVAHRRAVPHNAAEATRLGLAESLRHGVTHVAEIATAGWARAEIAASALPATVFLELIGIAPARIAQQAEAADEHLAIVVGKQDAKATWQVGLSPHAPYTVHPRLLQTCVALAREYDVPLAMHLAESPEELEFLATRGGPFRTMLEELGAWSDDFVPLTSPLKYLEALARAPRALVIHGNFLNAAEIAFLGQQRARLSAVFCPRTHAYFRHRRYPLVEFFESGACVAFGTDSRASNPSLDLLAEMHFVAAHYPEVAPADVLKLGTLNGAEALGLAATRGSLEPGKRADLAILWLPEHVPADPHELLMEGAAQVVATVIEGRAAWLEPRLERLRDGLAEFGV